MTEHEKMDGAFQRPSFNAYERIICNHLIESINCDPMQTVIHVTRAALSLKPEQAKTQEIAHDLARSLYTMAQRLYTATPMKDEQEKTFYHIGTGTLDYGNHIKPWARIDGYGAWVPRPQTKHYDNYQGAQKDEKSLFDYHAQNLSIGGYQHMCSDFLLYAIPIVEDMTRKLAERISPETYTEMLRLYHGERRNERI